MSDLEGKVALITGAGSGIGAATALLFARRGAKLSLSGRNEVNLQRVGDECARAGSEQPLVVVAELTCEAVSRMSPTWSTLPSRSSVDWTFWSTTRGSGGHTGGASGAVHQGPRPLGAHQRGPDSNFF